MRLLLLLNAPISGVAAALSSATAAVLASATVGGSAGASSSTACTLGATAGISGSATAASSATVSTAAGIAIGGSAAVGSAATASASLSGSAAAADLVDAIEAIVQAQLVAPGTLAWFGAGKAPPGQTLPYAEIEDFDEDPDDWQDDADGDVATFDDYADIPINIYASSKVAAKALGRQIADLLTDAALSFADGDLLYLRRGPKGTAALDPDQAPGGGDCWSLTVMFRAITAKTIA